MKTNFARKLEVCFHSNKPMCSRNVSHSPIDIAFELLSTPLAPASASARGGEPASVGVIRVCDRPKALRLYVHGSDSRQAEV